MCTGRDSYEPTRRVPTPLPLKDSAGFQIMQRLSTEMGCRVANGLLMAGSVVERRQAAGSGFCSRCLPFYAACCRHAPLEAVMGR